MTQAPGPALAFPFIKRPLLSTAWVLLCALVCFPFHPGSVSRFSTSLLASGEEEGAVKSEAEALIHLQRPTARSRLRCHRNVGIDSLGRIFNYTFGPNHFPVRSSPFRAAAFEGAGIALRC